MMRVISRGFAAALAVAATGLFAAPAAAQGAPSVGLFVPGQLFAPDSPAIPLYVTALSSAPVVLPDRVIEIDISGLNGVVTITSSPSCKLNDAKTVYSCTSVHPAAVNGRALLVSGLDLKPAAGVAPGAAGKLKVTLSATGFAPATAEANVTIGDSVDLTAGPDLQLTGAPGGTVSARFEVTNNSRKATDGIVALFEGDYGLTAAKQYSNCTYFEGRLTSCYFGSPIAPGGETYITHEELKFALAADVRAPGSVFLGVDWNTKAEFDLLVSRAAGEGYPLKLGQPGTGDSLRLVAKPSAAAARSLPQVDPDQTDNYTTVTITVEGDNPFDFAAIGASASGTAGQTVTFEVGFKNLGPAVRFDGRSGENVGIAMFTLPPGSALAAMPAGCVALKANGDHDLDNPGNLQARTILCRSGVFLMKAGEQKLFTVKLTITEVIADATGSFKMLADGECDSCIPDGNPANDSATVVLNASRLPTTGVQVGLIAGAGGLIAVAGAVLFVLTRRRRLVN